jgi:hypothetical protein
MFGLIPTWTSTPEPALAAGHQPHLSRRSICDVGHVRLVPYVLLAVLVLGTGLGIGLGLSEAPARSAPGVVINMTPKLLPARDHWLIAVFMKVGATVPEIASVRAAFRRVQTTNGCRFTSTQASRRDAREDLSPSQYAALRPIDFAPQIGCLVTQFTPATRSLFDWLSRQPGVREVQGTYLGPTRPAHTPEAAVS